MTNYDQVRIGAGLTHADIAKMFGYASTASYMSATRRPKIERGVEDLLLHSTIYGFATGVTEDGWYKTASGAPTKAYRGMFNGNPIRFIVQAGQGKVIVPKGAPKAIIFTTGMTAEAYDSEDSLWHPCEITGGSGNRFKLKDKDGLTWTSPESELKDPKWFRGWRAPKGS